MANLSEIREQSANAAEAVCEAAHLRAGDLFVVGCSSSEVIGDSIGTNSSLEAAEAVFEGIYSTLQKRGIYLAAQCCEHLNRALIVERKACECFDLEEVNVIPQPKAGGSFGTTAYKRFADPVAVESLRQKASAGMDVGCTLIGMHIKPVVVPLRIGKIFCNDLSTSEGALDLWGSLSTLVHKLPQRSISSKSQAIFSAL